MKNQEIFKSATRSSRDYAGVFEYDGETGYFYLYDLNAKDGKKIINDVSVVTHKENIESSNINVNWSKSENMVGLYIFDTLWAAFDLNGGRYGGNYRQRGRPFIPREIAAAFEELR